MNIDYRRIKTKKHIEDNFDLDEYIANSEKARFEKRYKKNKGAINIISIFIVLFSIILIFLFYQLVSYYADLYKNDLNTQNNIINLDYDYVDNSLPLIKTNKKDIISTNKPEIEPISIPPQIVEKKMSDAILDLRKNNDNEDIIGYVKIDNTQINNIVVQSSDNDFYLNHDVTKSPNKSGSIFMDFENDINNLSRNTVLYGHNMRNETMFHNIRYYNDEFFFNSHKYINLLTLYEKTKWEVFAFYSTGTDFYYIKTGFSDENDFQDFINDISAKSFYSIEKPITINDKLLTLSTCTNDTTNDTRYVVHARLVESVPIK